MPHNLGLDLLWVSQLRGGAQKRHTQVVGSLCDKLSGQPIVEVRQCIKQLYGDGAFTIFDLNNDSARQAEYLRSVILTQVAIVPGIPEPLSQLGEIHRHTDSSD